MGDIYDDVDVLGSGAMVRVRVTLSLECTVKIWLMLELGGV